MADHTSLFSKKTFVVITGASRGLGKSIALQFGAKFPPTSVMVLMDILPLESVRSEVLSVAPYINVLVRHYDQGNVEEKDYFKDIFTKILVENNFTPNEFEQSMIVHNCATLGPVSKRALDLSDATSVQKYIDINLTGMILLNSIFFQTFSDAAKSRIIVTMSSAHASTPLASYHLYYTGKAARDMYMRVLALEEPSLRILLFSPASADTDMAKEVEEMCINQSVVTMLKKFRAEGIMTTPDVPIARLVQILEENQFENAVLVESVKLF